MKLLLNLSQYFSTKTGLITGCTHCFPAHIAASELRMTDLFIKNKNQNLSQIRVIKENSAE